jgi:hypothetical protein
MLYKGAVAQREWPLSMLNLFLDVVPQRLQNRNRQHLKHRGCTMHQFVCRYRLAHVVQLKQIARLGFQFFLGVSHARPTQTAGASSGTQLGSFSNKIHMMIRREERRRARKDIYPTSGKSRPVTRQSVKPRSSLAPLRRLFEGISDDGLTDAPAASTSHR